MIFRILEDQLAQKSRESKAADQRFMQLALTLGRRGQGRTWPNPAVGALVVKDGVIIGRGWTQPGGRPHAEPEALKAAGEAARAGPPPPAPRGGPRPAGGAARPPAPRPGAGTLSPFLARSPPCTDAIIA